MGGRGNCDIAVTFVRISGKVTAIANLLTKLR